MEIKVSNRTELIQAIKGAGFVGPFELAAVKSWASENGVELPDDVDQIWSATVKIGRGETTKAANTDSVEAKRIREMEEEIERNKLEIERFKAQNPSRTPANFAGATHDAHQHELKASSFRHQALAKSYNRKAANRKGLTTTSTSGQAQLDLRNETVFDDADKAEAFGAFVRLSMAGHHSYPQKALDEHILKKSMITTTNTLGGALIPDDFSAELISLKEIRGIARQLMGTIPMSRETLTYPRRTGGLTVYAPGESGTITASDVALNNVMLTANKIATLTAVSTELFNDAAMSVSDLIATEIAYAFADAEDKAFLLGDGTSTYWGYTGINGKWVTQATSGAPGTDTNQASVIQGSSATYSSLTLPDFQKVAGRLPQYAAQDNPFWLMHRGYFYNNCVRLLQNLGGVTYAEGAQGPDKNTPMFLGYPVRFMQVGSGTGAFSPAPATKTINCAFGSFRLGAKFGEVRGSMSIATSDQFYFNQDMIAVRGLERIAITVHDYGNYDATAANQVPGPFVGLATA